MAKPMPPGSRFGRLSVIGRTAERSSGGMIRYACRCDCGGECVVRGDALRRGVTRSCGCLYDEAHAPMAAGDRHGKLVVIAEEPARKVQGHRSYRFRCDCGADYVAVGYAVKGGDIVSCGCVRREVAAAMGRRRRTKVARKLTDTTQVNFKLDEATRDGLSRIALARGLTVDRSAFKGEPNRSAALRQLVIEELARMDAAAKLAGIGGC